MPTLKQLEQALIKADAAGDTESARRLAPLVAKYRGGLIGVPGEEEYEIPELRVREPEPTIGEEIVGAGETLLTTATGATSGTLGMIGGTLKGMAEEMLAGNFGTREAADRIEQQAMGGMQALTYAPRTQAGQEQVQAIGEVAQHLPPVIPVTAELAATGQAIRQAAPAIARTKVAPRVQQTAAQAKRTVSQAGERLRQVVPKRTETPGVETTTPALTPEQAALRQQQAGELPVPIKLTEGQKSREFGQQRFERETAKMAEPGAPLRERFTEQNLQLQQNLDAFIDKTGAQAPDLRSVGLVVDKALRDRAAKDKVKIRSLYKEAEKAGEMEQPVVLGQLVRHLDESAPESVVANVLPAIRAKAIQIGAAVEGPDGQLIAKPVSLKDAELLRKSVNASTNMEPTNIRQAGIMKGLIDDETASSGGNVYQKARQARANYAKNYENVGLVKQLLGTKRGTDDRGIALEDTLRRSVLAPSTALDGVRQIRRLLQTAGDEGKQAWKELQGGTLRHIKDQALKSVSTDQQGNRILSPSQLDRVINQLDQSGKLDFVFGKKGAEQLRVINDVAKTVATAPPGAVNTSNTATVLAGLMDVAMTGATGVPAPIATSVRWLTDSLKDAKLKARVKKALGE